MSSISLKTKNRVIVKFINGSEPSDISVEEGISLNSVEEVIGDWRKGYLTGSKIEDIGQELNELVQMLKEKELTVHDLLDGFHYYSIFKGKEKERVLAIVNEIYSMDQNERDQFTKTVEKMMNFSRYRGIDYVDIPIAIEEMVEKGKEIRKELQDSEKKEKELKEILESLKTEIEEMEGVKEELAKQINLSNYLNEELSRTDSDGKAVKTVIQAIKQAGFSGDKLVDVSNEIIRLKSEGMSVDQFLKLSKYFEELNNLGLTIPMIRELEGNLKEYGMDIYRYLNERASYVRDKTAYIRSVKDLADTQKKAEKQIAELDREIAKKRSKL
jgi:flagellar motility protein MotE (MotC chaperone)